MWLSKFFGTYERPSPSDWVLNSQEFIDWVNSFPWQILRIPLVQKPLVWIPDIPDTNSMDGVFDVGNNNILIAGANPSDNQSLIDALSVGDIAVYHIPQTCTIHRIVEIKNDKNGRYFKFRGDNNPSSDPYKIRDSDIKWISIGTIY
jgi:hypothetical protein